MTRATWLLPLALLACSSGADRPERAPATVAPATAGPGATQTTAPPTTPAPIASIAFTTEREDAHFSTPTGNIGCYVGATGGGCEVARHDWPLPPKPRDCEFDWGAAINVADGLATVGVCASDTLLGAPRVLAYGTGIRVGVMECVSETSGVTCRNVRTRHGFFISRASYKTF